MLSIYLECEVSVLISNRIPSYQQEGILSKAVTLDSEQQVLKLFACEDPGKVEFANIDENSDKEAL